MESPIIDVHENLRLLGTAHVASTSVDAVKQQIELWKPDVVAVELCKTRHDALTSKRRLDREGLLKVIKEGKAPMMLMQSMLSAEQRKMGLDEGVQPGAELLAAVEEAKSRDIKVELVDRDIQTTLRRAWKRMRLREKFRLFKALIEEDDEDEEFDIDEMLGDSDLLSTMMEELRKVAPGAGEVLIDERDEFISSKIQNIDGRVLAIMGAGHLEGVAERLSEKEESDSIRMSELATNPAKSYFMRIFPWLFPLFIIGAGTWMWYNAPRDQLVELLAIWTIANALVAALACIIARGHPLAVITAAVASPITSLNPMLAAGWFAGYVQLKLREPTAEDLKELLKLEEMKVFWSNKAGRVLLVTALTNIGSTLGAMISIPAILGMI